MGNVNYQWVNQQMAEAKVRVGVGTVVMTLLETWEGIDISAENAAQVMEVFSKLAQGHALVVAPEEETWVPALPGQITIGDQVRVLANGYSGALGTIHNGRVGRIVAIRSGDVLFKSTDGKEPALDGVHYSPYKLEKRIR